MTTTYLGGTTLGQAIPGLLQSLGLVGSALVLLRDTVNNNSALLQSGIDGVTGAMSDLETAKDGFVAGPIQAVNDQVDTALAYLNSLSGLDSSAFLTAALAAMDTGRSFVAGLLPDDYLAGVVSGVTGGVGAIQGQADTLVGTADDMTDVTQQTAAQAAALQAVKGALDTATVQALSGVVAYAEQLSQLAASGVHTFWYDGTLGAMGGDLDGALPASGLSSGSVIAGPVLVVDSANTTALAALQAVFGAS
jgi:hypothetical protein